MEILAKLATAVGLKKTEKQEKEAQKRQHEAKVRDLSDQLSSLRSELGEIEERARTLNARRLQEIGAAKTITEQELKVVIKELTRANETIQTLAAQLDTEKMIIHNLRQEIRELDRSEDEILDIEDLTDAAKERVKRQKKLDEAKQDLEGTVVRPAGLETVDLQSLSSATSQSSLSQEELDFLQGLGPAASTQSEAPSKEASFESKPVNKA